MAGDLHRLADECRERLGVEIPMELYVYSSPQFNAACVKPESGRLFILFSSSLLEAFRGPELKFVLGHELGHHLYGHHDIPIGYLLKGQQRPPPSLALRLFAWSRYAEISADRAGAACSLDLEAEARALFRLSSGLTGSVVDFRLDDFLAQVDEMQIESDEPGQGASQEDWFSTHPFSPLRVKALRFFHHSEFVVPHGNTVDYLEAEVQTLLALMEPSYLEEQSETAEAMRRLLFAGTIAIADAANGISENEIEIFEQFFGQGAFSERLNIEKIKGGIDSRIEAVCDKTPHSRRIQLIRDLCVVAQADGFVHEDQRALLNDIAQKLDVQESIIEQTLSSTVELD